MFGHLEATGAPLESEPTPESVKSYLKGLPDIYYHRYRLLRLDFYFRLNEFAREAKGSLLDRYAQRLHEEFDRAGDLYLLKIFKVLELRSNPIALDQVLSEERRMPALHIAREKKIMSDGYVVPAWYRGQLDVYFDIGEFESFQKFRATFLHEVIHSFGGEYAQKFLDEAITHLIGHEAFGDSFWPGFQAPRDLAAALYELDRGMVVNWYCQGDDYEFEKRLATNLAKTYPEDTGWEIAQEVLRLPRVIRRLQKGSYEKYGLGELPKPGSAFYEFFQRDFQERASDLVRGLTAKIRAAQRPPKRHSAANGERDQN